MPTSSWWWSDIWLSRGHVSMPPTGVFSPWDSLGRSFRRWSWRLNGYTDASTSSSSRNSSRSRSGRTLRAGPWTTVRLSSSSICCHTVWQRSMIPSRLTRWYWRRSERRTTSRRTSTSGVCCLRRSVNQESMTRKGKISLCSREVTSAQPFSLKKASSSLNSTPPNSAVSRQNSLRPPKTIRLASKTSNNSP